MLGTDLSDLDYEDSAPGPLPLALADVVGPAAKDLLNRGQRRGATDPYKWVVRARVYELLRKERVVC